MEIKAWKGFSKKKNSTKRPADQEAIKLQVRLKENTSVENPTFILLKTSDAWEYNYFYGMGHYYYVSDIVSTSNSTLEFKCAQDVLATYKPDIFNTKAYILYGSSNYQRMITDSRVAMHQSIEKEVTSIELGQNELFGYFGTFLVSVVNDFNIGQGIGAQLNGMASVYALTMDQLYYLANVLLNDDDILESLQKQFQSPFQAIVSCKWVPYRIPEGMAIDAPLRIGTHNISVNGETINAKLLLSNYITEPFIERTYAFETPNRYLDFRDSSPYTSIQLVMPYCGTIDVNPIDIAGSELFNVKLCIDALTGDIVIRVLNQDESVLLSMNRYNMSVDLPLAQITSDTGGMIGSTLGGIASTIGLISSIAAPANPALGALGKGAGIAMSAVGLASSINSGIASSMRETVSVKGSLNSRVGLKLPQKLEMIVRYVTTNDITDDFVAKQGRPVMQVDLISNHGPYVQCSDASINISGMSNDKDEVNNYLNSGLYLE